MVKPMEWLYMPLRIVQCVKKKYTMHCLDELISIEDIKVTCQGQNNRLCVFIWIS
jgi:hypothetical protein